MVITMQAEFGKWDINDRGCVFSGGDGRVDRGRCVLGAGVFLCQEEVVVLINAGTSNNS